MIQHVRRKLASLLPASADSSIPLSVILQTAVASVLCVTLRFSSLLVLAASVAITAHPAVFSSHFLAVLTVTAWSDRSGVSYLRVRRRAT